MDTMATNAATLGFDIDDEFEPVTSTSQGRKGELDQILEEVGKLPVKVYAEGDEGFRKQFAGLKHSQQVVIPKKDAKSGKREPTVTTQQLSAKKAKYGKNSDYHHRTGHYFDLELSHRVSKTNPGARTPQTYGILVVYKVEAKTDAPPVKK